VELKGFAQKSVETFEPVLVDQVISEAVTLVRRESAGVEFDVPPTSRPVWVSGQQCPTRAGADQPASETRSMP
jgi:two-component system C4-dicarboxylate transport sensor histidine kinase DctB